MTITIAYGRSGMDISIPDDLEPVVLRAKQQAALSDPVAAVRDAVREPIGASPLGEAARAAIREHGDDPSGTCSVGIAFNDISRATPNHIIIPVIIDELLAAGVRGGDITLFNATGTHRSNSTQELESILTPGLVRDYRIVQNDCTATDAHRELGRTSRGNVVKVLDEFVACDLRIATGFVEPHFFAGYSGGGKAVVPGLAHLDTILFNHGPAHMDHPDATWGKTRGNPLWEDLAEAAAMADPTFLVNVAMNSDKEVTAAFAGSRADAHEQACGHVAEHVMAPVDREFDVVITSNSGHPLDLNLYQAVKGMSAAARVVRPGGTIIIAAECWDGIPEHGLFAELIAGASSADDLLATLRTEEYHVRDAWQAHIFALIRSKARITLVSSGLGREQLPAALCDWAPTVEAALEAARSRLGTLPSVCVLPDGPLTIPTVVG